MTAPASPFVPGRPIPGLIYVWRLGGPATSMNATNVRSQIPRGVDADVYVKRDMQEVLSERIVQITLAALRRYMTASTIDEFEQAHAAAHDLLERFELRQEDNP